MNPSSSFCPHRSAIPAESDGGKFLANERLLRNCAETNGASPMGFDCLTAARLPARGAGSHNLPARCEMHLPITVRGDGLQ